MRIPGLKRLPRIARWARSRFQRRALILGYHRIAEVDNDPFGVCISPDAFRRHLEIIAQRGRFVSLESLAEALQCGELEPRSVVLTFDDAYAETLDIVEPMLAEFEAHATVFAIASNLGGEPWWDRLGRSICHARRLPTHLGIDLPGFVGPRAVDPAVSAPVQDRDFTGRHTLLLRLYRVLLHQDHEQREMALSRIAEWAGPADETVGLARTLSGSELVTLAASPWVDVGSHTVTHPMLAELPESRQREELRESKRVLESVLGRNVALFSYPNGSRSELTESLVKEAGFTVACASQIAATTGASDRFRLPRVWPYEGVGSTAVLGLWLGRGTA